MEFLSQFSFQHLAGNVACNILHCLIDLLWLTKIQNSDLTFTGQCFPSHLTFFQLQRSRPTRQNQKMYLLSCRVINGNVAMHHLYSRMLCSITGNRFPIKCTFWQADPNSWDIFNAFPCTLISQSIWQHAVIFCFQHKIIYYRADIAWI